MSQHNHADDCPEDLIPTRRSLLSRLKNWEDNESWRNFFDTYWKLILNFALQRGLRHEEAQEVVQETVVAVAKSIGTFRYDPKVCAFKTWLLGVTRSKIANRFARRASQPAFAASARSRTPPSRTPAGNVCDRAWKRCWPTARNGSVPSGRQHDGVMQSPSRRE